MDILAPCWYFRFLGLNKFQYSSYVIFCAGHPWIVDDRISLDKPLDSAILSHLKQFSETNKLKKMDLHADIDHIGAIDCGEFHLNKLERGEFSICFLILW